MSKAVRERKISPTELVDAHLGQIRNDGERINAFVAVYEESAIQAAARATEALSRSNDLPPLHGIPVTIKDSLPQGFDYVGASPVPTWTNGRTFYWNFTNVAPGAHSLTMSARVNATFSGTQLVNWAFLNYTTVGGYPLVGSTSSVTVAIPELSDMLFVVAVPLVILGLKARAKRREQE